MHQPCAYTVHLFCIYSSASTAVLCIFIASLPPLLFISSASHLHLPSSPRNLSASHPASPAISPLNIICIFLASPPDITCISSESPLHLPCIYSASTLHLLCFSPRFCRILVYCILDAYSDRILYVYSDALAASVYFRESIPRDVFYSLLMVFLSLLYSDGRGIKYE